MEPTTTRVPAVVDSMLLLVQAALDDVGTGGRVFDGPTHLDDLTDDAVVVAPLGEQNPIRVTHTHAGGLSARPVEEFTITCLASSWSGTPGLKARRDRVLAVLGAVDARLRADPLLGGVCDQVRLGDSLEWAQDQTERGPVCEVAFSITGRAWL